MSLLNNFKSKNYKKQTIAMIFLGTILFICILFNYFFAHDTQKTMFLFPSYQTNQSFQEFGSESLQFLPKLKSKTYNLFKGMKLSSHVKEKNKTFTTDLKVEPTKVNKEYLAKKKELEALHKSFSKSNNWFVVVFFIAH